MRKKRNIRSVITPVATFGSSSGIGQPVFPYKINKRGLTGEQVALLQQMAADYNVLDPNKSYFWISKEQTIRNIRGERQIVKPGYHLQQDLFAWLFENHDIVEKTEQVKRQLDLLCISWATFVSHSTLRPIVTVTQI